MLGLSLGIAIAAPPRAPDPVPPPEPAAVGRAVLPADFDPSRSLSPLVKAVAPAVVTIEVGSDDDPPMPPELLEMFGMDPHGLHSGEGSGFVITPDGLVLTNHHVIASADHITLVMSDGERISARVLGGDADLDVALLQAESSRAYTFVPLGDSDGLEVGDWVVAMGNGLGLGPTVTAGIVSGTGRRIGHGTFGPGAFLQTDAAINQGNSGGPLFDLEGRVVGMSTAIIAGANSVGFAIPSNLIGGILDDLRTRGRVARGYLGVQPQTLNEELRLALGVRARAGALVTSVTDDTPAARSGMRTGDVVLEVDGRTIATKSDLVSSIGNNQPGDEVELTIERDGKVSRLKVTLTERPDPGGAVDLLPTSATARVGLSLSVLGDDEAAEHGVKDGVRVDAVRAASPPRGACARATSSWRSTATRSTAST
ncbi:MAG: trypsin-like peptidase domain-containing protein [Myxococcota bacterium]